MNNIPRFLPNGIAIFPKRGQAPPPDMEGYQRKGTNPRTVDAWIFIPLWQECQWRQRTVIARDEGCKCPRVVMYCRHPEGINSLATLSTCTSCTLWNVERHQSSVELSGGESVGESIMMRKQGDTQCVTERFEAIISKGAIFPTEDRTISDAEGEDHSISRMGMENLVE